MVDAIKNRITKEYEDLKKQEMENQIFVTLVGNDIRHWKGKIKGPVSPILLNNLIIYSYIYSFIYNLFTYFLSLILFIKVENIQLTLSFQRNIHLNHQK